MRTLKSSAILFAVVLSTNAMADKYFAPSHSCFKPTKPYEFRDQWEVDQFKSDVEQYKYCIQNFVDEQNDAIELHQQAANEAIEEWNDFVNYEL